MIESLNFLLEANLILVFSVGVYILWVSKEHNFQLRRLYILISVMASLCIPFVQMAPTVISESIDQFAQVSVITLPEIVIGETVSEDISKTGNDWLAYFGWTYIAVMSLLMIRLIVRLNLIRGIIKKGRMIQDKGFKLIDGKGKLPTFSFFNILVISDYENMKPQERDQVLSHELVHVNQFHSVDVLILELLSIVFWYNPVVWFLKKAQAENHEYIADLEVEKEFGRHAYQELLVKMTIDRMSYVGNYFSKIETLKRINMMNKKRKKTNKLRMTLASLSMLLVMSTLACTDGLIDSNSDSEAVKLPEAIAQKMDQLKKEHPEMTLDYYEVEPKIGGYNSEFHSKIDSRDILFISNFKERNRLGIIYNRISSYVVYDEVDQIPQPKEGIEAFYGSIMKSMKYPTEARQQGVEGRVFVQFIVDTKGNIVDVKAIKGIGAGCDREAVRVVKELISWIPGMKDGVAVDTRMVLPISFQLPEISDEAGLINEDISTEKK